MKGEREKEKRARTKRRKSSDYSSNGNLERQGCDGGSAHADGALATLRCGQIAKQIKKQSECARGLGTQSFYCWIREKIDRRPNAERRERGVEAKRRTKVKKTEWRREGREEVRQGDVKGGKKNKRGWQVPRAGGSSSGDPQQVGSPRDSANTQI